MQQIETYALTLHATSTDTVQIIKLDLNLSQFFPKKIVSACLFGRKRFVIQNQIPNWKLGFYFLNSRNSKQQNLKCSVQIGKKFVCTIWKITWSSQDSRDEDFFRSEGKIAFEFTLLSSSMSIFPLYRGTLWFLL